MTHFLRPVRSPDARDDEEFIAVPDLSGAIRLATERAYEIIAADLAAGTLNPNGCILVRDDTGKTLHIVQFSDLIDGAGEQPS